jgi:hypothetical protein
MTLTPLTRHVDANSYGHPGPTRDAWHHALDILHQLDHPDAARIRIKLKELDQLTAPTNQW